LYPTLTISLSPSLLVPVTTLLKARQQHSLYAPLQHPDALFGVIPISQICPKADSFLVALVVHATSGTHLDIDFLDFHRLVSFHDELVCESPFAPFSAMWRATPRHT